MAASGRGARARDSQQAVPGVHGVSRWARTATGNDNARSRPVATTHKGGRRAWGGTTDTLGPTVPSCLHGTTKRSSCRAWAAVAAQHDSPIVSRRAVPNRVSAVLSTATHLALYT